MAHLYRLIIQQCISYAHVKRIPFLSGSRKDILWPTWYLYIYSCLGIYVIITVPVVTAVPYMVTVVSLSALKSRLHVTLIKRKSFCFHFIEWKVKNDKPVFLRWPSPCLWVLTRSNDLDLWLWTTLDATGQTSWNSFWFYLTPLTCWTCTAGAYQVSYLLGLQGRGKTWPALKAQVLSSGWWRCKEHCYMPRVIPIPWF